MSKEVALRPDAFKAAEQRGYAKGYAAGKRRKARLAEQGRADAERQAFRRRAFLAALPACIAADDWTRTMSGAGGADRGNAADRHRTR